MNQLLDPPSFLKRLRSVGMTRYHDKHPYHVAMNEGKLSQDQVKGWIVNRFYYQRNIPIKDAALISNCPIREVRRLWLHRISDHDGQKEGEGGIENWLRLGEAAGISREDLWSAKGLLPKAKVAVDSYVHFVRTQPWPVGIASSLTELFAPDLMKERIKAFEKYYTWIKPFGLDYFKSRVTQAKADSDQGLELVFKYCDTRELQEEAVKALQFKCGLLWDLLDAMAEAYSKNLKP